MPKPVPVRSGKFLSVEKRVIAATSLEAELVSIAGVYRTSDKPLPANVQGRPAQVRLQAGPDGEKLVLAPIN